MKQKLLHMALIVTLLLVNMETNVFAENHLDNSTDDNTHQEENGNQLMYTVDFKMNGGEPALESQKVLDSDKLKPVETPKKQGYTFDGWFTHPKGDPRCKEWNFEEDIVLGNMILFAYYTEEQYTVIFELDEESDVKTISGLKYGERLQAPEVPEKEGYKFEGWYKDNEKFEEVWDFEKDVISKDLILYSKWDKLPIVDNSIDNTTEKSEQKPNEETEEKPKEEVEKPKEEYPETDDDKQPRTGISNNSLLFGGILAVAIVTIVILIKKRKK